MTLANNHSGVQPIAQPSLGNESRGSTENQLPLLWDETPRAAASHLSEWIDGSAVSKAIADLAIQSIYGQTHVLAFLRPSAINANRTYGGAVPMNKTAKAARHKFSNPCAGGWLAYGHAPIENGEMVPVTFKPDVPRLNADGKLIKYERPGGSRPVPYFPPLDATAYTAIAKRARLVPPTYESSWSAWLWLLKQPEVELILDEGEKKAAAACSHGFLTIGLAGIWNGCPKLKDHTGYIFGPATLIAELQWLRGIRPANAPLVIAFDASDKPNGRDAIRKARRQLGRLLAADGHKVFIRDLVQPANAVEFIKGTDDLLVHGGASAVESLLCLPLEDWLSAGNEQAITDYLMQPFKISNRRHQIIERHFLSSDINKSDIVALIGGHGTNKTGALADYAKTCKLISITHRRSLADNQGHRFGLAVKREGQILHALQEQGKHSRQIDDLVVNADGFITVVDSIYAGGSSELKPDECIGAVLFIDEADALLRHCLMSGTHIKKHRTNVLANLAACVAAAKQVVLAGSDIDETTLSAFEEMRSTNSKASIIQSTLKTAANRKLTLHRKHENLLQEMRNLSCNKQPFIFHTGSKQIGSKFAPINLAKLVRRWWPDAAILEMTAETIREPNHPASTAIENPKLLLDFDVVLASPVLETGFSIEDTNNHFKAVLGHTSGHVLPQAFVQSLGRLRSDAPRFIWCDHKGSRLGNGAVCVDELERSKTDHAEMLQQIQLIDAGEACGDASKYLRQWSKLAALQNWFANSYRHTVAVLLQQQGYEVARLDKNDVLIENEITDELDKIRDENIAIDSAAVAAAPLPNPAQLETLKKRQRLTKAQRQQLERGEIANAFGLANPNAEQVTATRNGSYGKALQYLLVIDSDARRKWEQQTKKSLTPSQRQFAPDTTKAMAPAVRARAIACLPWLLELVDIAGTGKTEIMHKYEAAWLGAIATGDKWRELYGFKPDGKTCRTFVSNMLNLMGYKLQRTQRRTRVDERLYWNYEVVDELSVLGRSQVQAFMKQALDAGIGTAEPVSFSL
ncbi:MAG: DUF3854 domain-containing protein [Actinobacteria bacterium]|nr:DUF3854 domain-containing protein [Actinomycetota bacterium]